MRSLRLLATLILPIVLSGCSLAPLNRDEERYFYAVTLADEATYLREVWPSIHTPQEVCPVHGTPTVSMEVPVADGMMAYERKYMKARVRRFPYSFGYVWSGSCESWGDRSEFRAVCPKCREEEKRWRQHHERDE